MEKYRQAAEKKLIDTKVHPDTLAREALVNAEFSAREREDFFNVVYGDILVDYFIQWVSTESHELKKREFIYNSALALGDVKSRMIGYETYGKNVRHLEDKPNE